MRRLFLYLSTQKQLRRWMETSPTARRLSSRFIAGETLDEALKVARSLQSQGLLAALDHLGENVTSLAEASAAREECTRALRAMLDAGIEGNISIKLTQFGLDLSERECRDNVEKLVGEAAARGGFVRIDMESSVYTARTIELVHDLYSRHGAIGPVIQAYLYRSEADINLLCERGVRVRLCKGAYLEPPEIAFPKKEDVDKNFVHLMQKLLVAGNYPAIATHDEAMIAETRRFAAGRGIPRERFEFQMLYGIKRGLQKKLVSEGYRLRLYVPYGQAWFPYFMRRLAERPANLLFLLKNL